VQIDVLKNVLGGVEDTNLSFKLTPPPKATGLGGGSTPTLTPSKALLMGQVRWDERTDGLCLYPQLCCKSSLRGLKAW
jgi:hypothetical protein